ncbi:hypothetical protein D3OALGA1CA_1798 [Olavius algarvensis associated proteobacterium Delta 3]|nr:hypothetical protein D3OALGA1CA_1798 [Olavius algarvensis associated proteobacterium Delta 3]CAB5136464.1 hypothetical protein D3OALGB2SA_3965 [Olavius algarvensis associated proteobacterium Delta 3]
MDNPSQIDCVTRCQGMTGNRPTVQTAVYFGSSGNPAATHPCHPP